jgi:hypothetical protein
METLAAGSNDPGLSGKRSRLPDWISSASDALALQI